ncbi:MAG: aldehyde dehydrogenase family protein [Solirubrobacterales bacterium]
MESATVQEEIEVQNPATGETIASVPVDSTDSVAATVARVRANQPAWEELGFKGRREWLNKLRDWLLDNSDRIADTLKSETGKVRAEATLETPYLADQINFYGSKAEKFIGEQKIRPNSPLSASRKLRLRYSPYPVVGLISPWNFPLVLSLGDAIPALMAGAAVVMKPSEVTPLGLSEIVTAWQEEIGGPDVLAVVNGGAEAATALIDHSDFMGFTGSDVTGKKVMARAAETLTPVSLELGGKDPMVVLEGANLERAANAAAWGGMLNSGQMCISVERIYVEDGAYEEFVRKLKDKVDELSQGADADVVACDVGAMTMESQLAKVETQVDEAVKAGATVLVGGKRGEGPGQFYEPTVLIDVEPGMSVLDDETFGPVVTVTRVANEDEAIFRANDSRYGLSASVFGPRGRAEKAARRIEAGAVNVNDMIFNMLVPSLPMGGWKESGIGYRNGEYGIRKYCRSSAIVSPRLMTKSEPLWYPYTPSRQELVGKLTSFISGRGKRRFGK